MSRKNPIAEARAIYEREQQIVAGFRRVPKSPDRVRIIAPDGKRVPGTFARDEAERTCAEYKEKLDQTWTIEEIPEAINPRYLAYCADHRKSVDEMRAFDEKKWPGGRAAGFMIWISEKWRAWDQEHGYRHDHIRNDEEHDAFTQWLMETPS